jgi:Glycosyl hydrolases family 16
MPSRDSRPPLSVDGPIVEFRDEFDEKEVDPHRWVAHYLPHWTTPERSAARFDLTDDGLALRIDADQPAWRAEDGEMRVSNLQSGSWSGPLNSHRGQHRHRLDLVVRSPQPTKRLYTPTSGRFEATMRASPDPTTMLAFWLVGFEENSPDDCGEICVAELFGNSMSPLQSTVNVGVKAHHDPRLHDDMAHVLLPLDAAQWHTYAADWTAHGIEFYVDEHPVHHVAQRISYPMQLMVDLFEFPSDGPRDSSAYPKTGHVRSVRASAEANGRPFGVLAG